MEAFLTLDEARKRFAMSRTSFYRFRPKLIGLYGLQEVRFGLRLRKYRESSVNKAIKTMAETEAHVVID